MKRRRRHDRGEPLTPLEVALTPINVRQVLGDLATLGRIGAVLAAPPPPRPQPGVIEMREVAPGVFARDDNPPRRRPRSPLERIEHALAELKRGVHAGR